jgi:hypothetical protein
MRTLACDNMMAGMVAPVHRGGVGSSAVEERELECLLSRLDDVAQSSDHLLSRPFWGFTSAGRPYTMPRYIFLGPRGGGDTIRIGIFATIHGDEAQTSEALIEFVRRLELNPGVAQGYALFLYPVCNPRAGSPAV